MIVLAEITQGELIGTVKTVTQSHTVVVAYLVIYLAYELLRGVVVGKTARHHQSVDTAE